MDMIAELKKKQMVKEPLIYEGKDGAIEDIISGERLFQVSSWASPPGSVPAGRPSVTGGLQGAVSLELEGQVPSWGPNPPVALSHPMQQRY